jgi:single-strand DNA-binding protein
MASLNKVTLIGNLGQKPELRKTKEGTSVGNFSLATHYTMKDEEGAAAERVDWHRIVVWGRTAEVCAEHLDTGSLVYIEGRLSYREYLDKEDKERFVVEVVASDVQFLTRKKTAPAEAGPAPAAAEA